MKKTIIILLLLVVAVLIVVATQRMDTVEHSGGELIPHKDESQGIIYKYPDLETQAEYVHVLDWPPVIRLEDSRFSCTEAGEETARAGKTELKEIHGTTYCVTKESEGAAGSIYSHHAYAFPFKGKTAILTFTSRAVQCANYDERSRVACEAAQLNFDPDEIADTVARTLEEIN